MTTIARISRNTLSVRDSLCVLALATLANEILQADPAATAEDILFTVSSKVGTAGMETITEATAEFFQVEK